MPESHDLLDFLERLHDECVACAKELRFDKSFDVDGALMCLYATMVEYAGGIVALAAAEKRTCMMPIFRSMHEAYVDFANLFESRLYLRFMEAQHHKKWIGLLDRAANPNKYLDLLAKVDGREQHLGELRSKLKKLKRDGYEPLHVKDRYARAKMEDEYRSVYVLTSGAAHNDISALIGRHINMGEGEFGLALYKPTTPKDYRTVLDSAAGVLLEASKNVHRHFESRCQEGFDRLEREFRRVQQAYD